MAAANSRPTTGADLRVERTVNHIWTARAIAHALGISYQSVGRWERPDAVVSPATEAKYREAIRRIVAERKAGGR